MEDRKEEGGSEYLQCVILELSDELNFENILASVLFYMQAISMENENNRIAWFLVMGSRSTQICPCDSDTEILSKCLFQKFRDITLGRIETFVNKAIAGAPRGTPEDAMASAMMKSLCFINSLSKRNPRLYRNSRILIIKGSVEERDKNLHPQIINAVFAALKMQVGIDVIILGHHESEASCLQQAAHLTQGLFLKIPIISYLQQYLIECCLGDTATRRVFKIPKDISIDLATTCTCCGKKVNLAYICSVCLSTYCPEVAELHESNCRFCKSAFSDESQYKILLIKEQNQQYYFEIPY